MVTIYHNYDAFHRWKIGEKIRKFTAKNWMFNRQPFFEKRRYIWMKLYHPLTDLQEWHFQLL